MNIGSVKGIVTKSMLFALAAGAFALISPAKANAAQWQVGVDVGQPVYAYGYNAPAYGEYPRAYNPYYQERMRHEAWEEHERHEAWERRQAYLQHEYWEQRQRQHEYWEHRHHDRDDDDWR